MLDIKFIRENPDLIKEAARKKRIDFNVDELLSVEARRVELLNTVETMRAEQNSFTEKISRATDANERQAMIDEMRVFKETLLKKEEELKPVMETWRGLMLQVPNVPDISVPDGESDAQNLEVKKVGEPTHFDFTPKGHIELMLKHDMADFERGSKVSGFRGYFLKNDGALLANAVWQLAMKHFLSKGFTPMIVPSLVRRETFMGTGYLPQGEEDLYKTQDDDYLAGTAEVATMGYYMDEVLDKKDLPIKFFSFSPCFRREAGSHGKDTKGIFRIHEFLKYEQVVLCEASHEESVKHHEDLTKNSEELLKELKLPYRVVINCGADLGLGQVKKYDIEAWMPSQNKYRETHSSSYFHDFQTRRLGIKYRSNDEKLKFCHSLNNTAVATPRILISLLENNQRKDGSVKIPEVLQKYLNKEVIRV